PLCLLFALATGLGNRPAFDIARPLIRCNLTADRPNWSPVTVSGWETNSGRVHMGPQAAQSQKITSEMTMSEQADHLEEQMMHDLDTIITKSVFSNLTDGVVGMEGGAALQAKNPGKYFNMGADPRLPPMPEKPTLLDYFKNRFA